MSEPITFLAILGGIRTTVDGGTNVTLSLPESETEAIKKLLDAKNKNLQCAIVPED